MKCIYENFLCCHFGEDLNFHLSYPTAATLSKYYFHLNAWNLNKKEILFPYRNELCSL